MDTKKQTCKQAYNVGIPLSYAPGGANNPNKPAAAAAHIVRDMQPHDSSWRLTQVDYYVQWVEVLGKAVSSFVNRLHFLVV